MGPSEIWPILVFSAAIVFGAGQLVEKIKNGKYVSKEYCNLMHKNTADAVRRIDSNLDKIWKRIDGQTVKGEAE
jgi:hypothetical protein